MANFVATILKHDKFNKYFYIKLRDITTHELSEICIPEYSLIYKELIKLHRSYDLNVEIPKNELLIFGTIVRRITKINLTLNLKEIKNTMLEDQLHPN